MEDKLNFVNKPIQQMAIVLFLFVCSIVCFFLMLIDALAGLVLGCLLLFLTLIAFLRSINIKSMCNKFILTEKNIKVINIFNKVLRKKNWRDLKYINILYLGERLYTDNYICLYFTEEQINTEYLFETLKEKDIIVLKYTEENLNIIKKYTNLSINTEKMKVKKVKNKK